MWERFRTIFAPKQAKLDLQQQVVRERLVSAVTQQIHQSLKLEDILHTTVAEIRQFLHADRVIIYRFDPDASGTVVVESVAPGWKSMLGTVIQDCYFTKTYVHLYRQGRVQAINDIYAAELAPCHIDLLAAFQVRANLVVPIANEERLWGLLVVQQCSAPRLWQAIEIDLLKQLATQAAIAIHQSELYQQAQAELAHRRQTEIVLQQQANQQQVLREIAQRIRCSLDLEETLSTTVREVQQLLQTDRVLLYQVYANGTGRITTESVAAGYPALIEYSLPDEMFPQECHKLYEQGRICRVTDLETDAMTPCLAEMLRQFGVRSKLVVPILQGEELWGLLIAHHCSSPRRWQTFEIELLEHLATQVAIAIQQSELFGKMQQLNMMLEAQVQERTAQLQQALALEAALKRITDKVRDSLDEHQILQTAVGELAQLLDIDCCDTALYTLEAGTSTILYEYSRTLPPAQGTVVAMVDMADIYSQLLLGQHLQFCLLAPNHIRPERQKQTSILACPIFDDQGVIGDLWLSHSHSRYFNDLETRLVQQVANQCAIALRQARLYQTAQAQVKELEKLNQLKDDFLSTVSHELRTPMSNIKMATHMLEIVLKQAGLLGSESTVAARYFKILQGECQREISLINDLLDLARLDTGGEPLVFTPVDPQTFISKIAAPFAERASHQQQQLRLDLAPDLPVLVTDLSHLELILTELLHNACKYTPAGETITVAANTTATTWRLSVSNSGVELPARECEQVFEKFYRIPNNDPWKYGGTGLGLALLKKRVERLGATVRAYSRSGQMTFSIHFPRQDQS